jgi:hypothetical protein
MPQPHHGGTETRRTGIAKSSLSPIYISRELRKTIRWCGKQPKEPTTTTFSLTNYSTNINITCLFTYVYDLLERMDFSRFWREFKGSSDHDAAGIPGVKRMHLRG